MLSSNILKGAYNSLLVNVAIQGHPLGVAFEY